MVQGDRDRAAGFGLRGYALDRRCAGAFRVLTFEAFPNEADLRIVWRIPASAPNPARQYTRLSAEEKDEMVKRALKGEPKAALAEAYGVTSAYVHRLANRAKEA